MKMNNNFVLNLKQGGMDETTNNYKNDTFR